MNKQFWITNENNMYNVWHAGIWLGGFISNTLAEEYLGWKLNQMKYFSENSGISISRFDAYQSDQALAAEKEHFERRRA